jgi:hypothetical protein
VIIRFRDDLRLSDHAALHAGSRTGAPVICLDVLDEASPRAACPARWWLAQSLKALQASLRSAGTTLIAAARACRARKFDPEGAYARRWVPERERAGRLWKAAQKRESEGFALTAFRIPLSSSHRQHWGCDMDDDKPITEQATDAISGAAEATTETVKTAVKKVRKAAKKVAKKVTKKKAAKKAPKAKKAAKKEKKAGKKAAKKAAKKAPKKAAKKKAKKSKR